MYTEHKQQTAEEFEREIRQELLDEANKLRADRGLPQLTKEEANEIEASLGR